MRTNNGRRRREQIAAGAALLVLLPLLVLLMRATLHEAAIVEYEDGREIWRMPDKTAVCPGEAFTFPVTLTVQEGPAFVRIVESWCRAEDGICPRALSTVDELALLKPVTVRTTARRVAPEALTPGVWELHHINESHVNGKITVTGYGVRVTVKAGNECGNE